MTQAEHPTSLAALRARVWRALPLAAAARGDGGHDGVDHVVHHRERGHSRHEPALCAGSGARAVGDQRLHGGDDGVDADHALAAGALRLPPHLCRLHGTAAGWRCGGRFCHPVRPGAGGPRGRRAGRGRGAADSGHHHPARVRARRAGPRQRDLRHGRGAGTGDRPQHRRSAGGLVRLAIHLLHGRAVLPGVILAGLQVRAGHRARGHCGQP